MSAEILYGWEPGVHYVKVCESTRGQAKALVADETCEWFLDLRSRKVWLHERLITEEEAEGAWLDDWYPGYLAWIECGRDADGAEAWWEIRKRHEAQYANSQPGVATLTHGTLPAPNAEQLLDPDPERFLAGGPLHDPCAGGEECDAMCQCEGAGECE